MGIPSLASAVLLAALAVGASSATGATGVPADGDGDGLGREAAYSAVAVTDSPATTAERKFDKMGPCVQEDGTSCVWDARHQGNGEGDSFWATGHEGQRVFYRHAVAHRLEFGEWSPIPKRLWDERADLIHERANDGRGSRALNRHVLWDVGGTTLFVWPGDDRKLDFQVGTS